MGHKRHPEQENIRGRRTCEIRGSFSISCVCERPSTSDLFPSGDGGDGDDDHDDVGDQMNSWSIYHPEWSAPVHPKIKKWCPSSEERVHPATATLR